MRRKPNAEIVARAAEIEAALLNCYQTAPGRDKPHALALIVLGIEMLEELGVERERIRAACDKIVDTPPPPDPRADTTGT